MIKICEIKTSSGSVIDAEKLAAGLLNAKLAACVQISEPGNSHYHWQGAVEQSEEYFLAIKTSLARCHETITWIGEHHPYDVPEIICCEYEASETYGVWVEQETRHTNKKQANEES